MSRITVRQALQELAMEGYIYKLHGKGTFVAQKSYNQNLVKLYSFIEEMKKLNKTPSTKVLSFQKIVADDEALLYETSYLPQATFAHLTEDNLKEKAMYDIFYEDYQIRVTKAIERFSATSVWGTEAEFPKVDTNQPAMLIKRFAYRNEKIIEYTISVARGDKFDYTVELT